MGDLEHDIEEIEHTADWAIRVRARDRAGLLVAAARGMFGLLADLTQVATDQSFEVELRALDLETLLVDWLNELLYLSEAQGLVFSGFEVAELDADGGARLRAQARGGRPAGLNKHIKAATFAGLSIRRDGGAYVAELVFDV